MTALKESALCHYMQDASMMFLPKKCTVSEKDECSNESVMAKRAEGHYHSGVFSAVLLNEKMGQNLMRLV